MCCILICIGIICCYNMISSARFDNLCYYDNEMNFHYFNGLEKPISCMIYMINIIIIIFMAEIIIKSMYTGKRLNIFTRTKRYIIYVFILGIIISPLFKLDINHIIVSDNGFYNIKNLLLQSEFRAYSFNCFDEHFFMVQRNEIYLCYRKNDADGMGWRKELFIGYNSDNVYKLVKELDIRTNYKYELYDHLINDT